MFTSLLRNIAITGVAYGIVSGVGLLLAPFLIAAYGLGGYGQILIARTFLPTGFFALFDVGLGENTTRQVATARAGAGWDQLSGALSLLAVMAIAVGLAVGAAMYLGTGHLTRWFSIAADQRAGFSHILRITAILQPLLLLSLVAEGVVKGFERFDIMRTIEVIAAVSYAAGALALGIGGYGPNWIAGALLASIVLRFVIAAGAASMLLRKSGAGLGRWNRDSSREVVRWSVTMLSSKIVGSLQNQVAGPLIGLILSPAALGLYDVVVRLPRFAKVVFSLVGSTVLPLASRLRSVNQHAATGRLAYYGIMGAVAATWPAAVACAVFSQPLLNAWIDRGVGLYWPWQSLMFAITMFSVPISFGGAIALAEQTATRRLVRLAAIQVFIQLPISLALVGTLGQWSFILGQAVAVVATFPLQYKILRQTLFIERNLPLRMTLVAGIAASVALAIAFLHEPANVWELVALGGASVILASVLLPWAILDRAERAEILAMARRNFRLPR